jgi:transcriptional regulator with XRE-family HTH domain
MKHFKDRIKYALEKRGITPVEIAEMVGKSRYAIHKYLSGKSAPTPSSTVSLAEKLNVSYDWLRLGEGSFDDPFDSKKFYDDAYRTFEPREIYIKKQKIVLRKMHSGAASITLNLTPEEYSDLMIQAIK